MKFYKKVLVLGSGACKISQAGEFDYSGAQALKVLKSRGIKTVLLNPNIATVQTSGLADKTYLLPLTLQVAESVIQKERPDGILLSFGGQTALNLGVDLVDYGVLKKYDVDVLGTPVDSIVATEDREEFKKKLFEIKVNTPLSESCTSIEAAKKAAATIGYPVMMRSAFSLGGAGSGRCDDESKLVERLERAFSMCDQVLVEEYLSGWQEIEFEVVRDRAGHRMIACTMENFDPLGVHTGDSIVVAPCQSLSEGQLAALKKVAFQTIDHLGIIGECNIQFALRPGSTDYRVIEVNARLSRSSALASKAVGYPLAKVACRIALGENLDEMKSEIVDGKTTYFEEPAPKYVVVKVPRFDFLKFDDVERELGSEMKSVGEAMAIGETFPEALQKAIRMIDVGLSGLVGEGYTLKSLSNPTDRRLYQLYKATKHESPSNLAMWTGIDPFFITELFKIRAVEDEIESAELNFASVDKFKKFGFSDKRLAEIRGMTEDEFRQRRFQAGVIPIVKRVDPYGGKYDVAQDYMYVSYHGDYEKHIPSKVNTLVLGSGVYRIGSSIEFDYCCVSAAKEFKRCGRNVAILNCNPETVSTDYEEVDRLYFEEMTVERIADIAEFEGLRDVAVSFGGQTPNNLCKKLNEIGLNVLGTKVENIDEAEDRTKFSAILDELSIPQPAWTKASSIDEAKEFAKKVEYPVLIRPSYVLSGAGMLVVDNDKELEAYLSKASFDEERPATISKYHPGAREVDVDGAACQGVVTIFALSAHIENAGTHSGDASLIFPAPTSIVSEKAQKACVSYSKKLASRLAITGPFNVQFLVYDDDVMIIEMNVRASRSFPFVGKVSMSNIATVAATWMSSSSKVWPAAVDLNARTRLFGCKAAQFSFSRLRGADPVSGVEMASTGEVACLAMHEDVAVQFAFEAVGMEPLIKEAGMILVSSGRTQDKLKLQESLRSLAAQGFELATTAGTHGFLNQGTPIPQKIVGLDGPKELLDLISSGQVQLVINIPKNNDEDELWDDFVIRRAAVEHHVPLITNSVLAEKLLKIWSDGSVASDYEPMAIEDFRDLNDDPDF